MISSEKWGFQKLNTEHHVFFQDGWLELSLRVEQCPRMTFCSISNTTSSLRIAGPSTASITRGRSRLGSRNWTSATRRPGPSWRPPMVSSIFVVSKVSPNLFELNHHSVLSGAENATRWFVNWRMFFIVCSETFAYNDGNEWIVSHYLFAKKWFRKAPQFQQLISIHEIFI